jgi:hypothetical protein
LLAKARDLGYFQSAHELETLKRDSDFDTLRSRDDYKKLVGELEAKLKTAEER